MFCSLTAMTSAKQITRVPIIQRIKIYCFRIVIARRKRQLVNKANSATTLLDVRDMIISSLEVAPR